MKWWRVLAEKPWLVQPAEAVPLPAQVLRPDGAAQIALRFILAIVGVLFFLFIITFLARSQYPDFEALAGQPWQPFSDASRLWFNTAILACAGIAMHLALLATRRQRLDSAVTALSLAVFFTLGFLFAQYELWRQMQALGFYANRNPANSYFYLLTAVHGLHLVGGLVVLAHVVLRRWRDNSVDGLASALRQCTVYWHFLFGIWLILFALLTSRAETINALAALCGF
jgi:cytochrome c oxidase subunit III